jgi:CRP/FNR family transcriptional regulator, cyclic AMP receptor protein
MGTLTRPSVETLQRLPLFGGIPDDALAQFAEQAEPMAFAGGQLVFSEGEQAKSLFVVHEGLFEASKHDIQLTKFLPGDCFGEMSFLDMQPRSATVRASVASVVWSWRYQQIHARYCGGDQKCTMLLVMNMARELSRRLRVADDKLCARERTPSASFASVPAVPLLK